jgi:hypothetical protein
MYDRKTITVAQAKSYHEQLVAATNEALEKYTERLPDIYKQQSHGPTPFYTRVISTDQELAFATSCLAQPFRSQFSELFPFPREYNPLYEPIKPSVPEQRSTEENKDFNIRYREYKNELREYDKELKKFEKSEQEILDRQTPIQMSLWGSPLYDYYYQLEPVLIDLPFEIPSEQRFAGTWIIAPPGRGKTTLLHHLIAEDLKKHCTIVLMDSKGDLINGYKGYGDVIIINPRTAQINPLQLGSSTRSVEFLEYIFSALLETGMTALQKTLFRSVLTLLLKVPNATLETFRQVLTTGIESYTEYLSQCDGATYDFFTVGRPTEFNSATYKETKQQILWRLRLILSNQYLREIFTSPTTNVPFNELLDSGKVIIIDNSKDDLGEEGAEFFGRFFVALVWMAAVSRSRLLPQQKVPVYFYIDECHTVIKRDTKITTILDECRSQKIALILAHQRVAQIEPNVIDALNNCAIRLANSDDDAESLAKRFRVEATELRLPIGQFSCFVRDKTPQAVTINVPPFDTSKFPPAPNDDYHYTPQPRQQPSHEQQPQPRSVPRDGVEDF